MNRTSASSATGTRSGREPESGQMVMFIKERSKMDSSLAKDLLCAKKVAGPTTGNGKTER